MRYSHLDRVSAAGASVKDGAVAARVENLPIVSCLMAINRYDQYVPIAIRSILDQTFCEFELIILVNGDPAIPEKVRADFDDPRIIINYSPLQQLGHSLNRGLELARGEFIARMDGDDVSMPERFARQVHRLNERPELVLVSCGTYPIDTEGKDLPRRGDSRQWINRRLWLKNPICHPAVMFRKNEIVAAGGYAAIIAQDYELWLRLERRLGTFYEVMPNTLLKMRNHNDQTRGRVEGYSTSAGVLLNEFIVRGEVKFLLGAILMTVRGLSRKMLAKKDRPARHRSAIALL